MLIRKPLNQNNNSNPSVKKNVSLIGDFIMKYQRRDGFSSQDKDIKIVTHPGSSLLILPLSQIKISAKHL